MNPERVIIANQTERIPPCMYWSVDQVCDWINRIGMGIYEDCFRVNHVTGRKLIQFPAYGLCAVGVKDFKDMLYICKEMRKILWVHTLDFTTFDTKADPRLMYIEQKGRTGEWIDNLTYKEFLEETAPMFDAAYPYPGQKLPRQDFLRKIEPCPFKNLKAKPPPRPPTPPPRKTHSSECILCEKLKKYASKHETTIHFPPKNTIVNGQLLVGPPKNHYKNIHL